MNQVLLKKNKIRSYNRIFYLYINVYSREVIYINIKYNANKNLT